jgi:hypothetical protein
MLMWLIFIAIAAFIVFVGVIAPRSRSRKARASASDLATALGFELLDGQEAVKRMIQGASAGASPPDYETLPAPLRRLLEASGVATCLAGTSDGVRITIFTEHRGSGKSNTTYTVVRADYPKPLPFDLHIAYEGGFTRLGKALFGLRDLEIGDEAFDRAVRVKTNDEGAARAALGAPGARAAILGMIALSREAFATSTHARWEATGLRFDPSEIRTVIAALVPVSLALGSA